MKLPYEEAAEQITFTTGDGRSITGWINRNDPTQFFLGQSGESCARYHSYSDRACGTEGCANRITQRHGYTICQACRDQSEFEKWQKRYEKAVPWDRKTPVHNWAGEEFFFDEDSLADFLAEQLESGNTLQSLRLVLCEPDTGPHFDMSEFLEDHLPRDDDYFPYDAGQINKAVNDWIEAHAPYCWRPDGPAVLARSLEYLVADLCNPK